MEGRDEFLPGLVTEGDILKRKLCTFAPQEELRVQGHEADLSEIGNANPDGHPADCLVDVLEISVSVPVLGRTE